jgi:hypothetical protein
MNERELRYEVARMERELERLKEWRDQAVTPKEYAERADIVLEYGNHTRQARWHMDEADRLRNKQTRLQEHQEHSGQTWEDVFGE